MKVVRISVRHLVEFLLRSGDITSGTGGMSGRRAMQEGSRVHRLIQNRRGAGYRPEVPLKFRTEYGNFALQIEGRADGIETGADGSVTIEEIKGVYRDPDEMQEPYPVHLAQAKCYGAMYLQEHPLSRIRIRMTYCGLENEKVRSFSYEYAAGELTDWFQELCRKEYPWVKWRVDWEEARNASVRPLEFPFPYRKKQRDMVAAVYHTIQEGKQLFAQAPTGVGKTMSALFPAVHSLASGKSEKIFYLTAKTITRSAAEEAAGILSGNGLVCLFLSVTAKEKICAAEEVNCTPEACPRANGHFDRINDALYDMLTHETKADRETILAYAGKWTVCPYLLQLDLADFADVIICDYNYAFDPFASMPGFFGENAGKQKAVLLIDEAHNLVERGRDMFSKTICRKDFTGVRKAVKSDSPKLYKALGACIRAFRILREEQGEFKKMKDVGGIVIPLMNLAGILETLLTGDTFAKDDPLLHRDCLELYFKVHAFLFIYDNMDDGYCIYGEARGKNDYAVCLRCMDPSGFLQITLDRISAAVFFSATLYPMSYYRSLLTTRTDSYQIYLPSPFDPKNRLIALAADVSTSYQRRGKETYGRIAEYVDAAVSAKAGHYLVFFPSYRMLEDVADSFLEKKKAVQTGEDPFERMEYEGGQVLLQRSGMSEPAQEEFLSEFRRNPDDTLVGFCVMGGIFSEGIDLAGNDLIGAVVVGTGLPQVSRERDLLMHFYEKRGRSGFDYAYRIPGMNKVLQAAGRVIRTDEDKGVILLLDSRFEQRDYDPLFPREWEKIRIMNRADAAGILREFWEKLP